MKRTSKIVSLFLVVVLAISSFAFGDISAGAVSKIKSNKGDFYFSLNKSLYDGASYPSHRNTYKIYAFNVNSYSAKTCNKKLFNYCNRFYKNDYDAYVNGCSLIFGVSGNTYKNGNILSIKQKVTGSSWWSYKACNVNKKTGKEVTNESLFKMYGYTKKNFYNALKNKQISKTKSLIKQGSYLQQDANEMLAYAKSSESRKGLQVYIDSSGKLCAVAKINTKVAADIYEYIFKFSK